MKNKENKKTYNIKYRYLIEGELIEPNDEVYDDVIRGWRKTICNGSLASNPAYTSHRRYRRIIS